MEGYTQAELYDIWLTNNKKLKDKPTLREINRFCDFMGLNHILGKKEVQKMLIRFRENYNETRKKVL